MQLILWIILLSQSSINSSQYSFVQPDQLEYPGEEYVSLFAVFVSKNITLHSNTNQLRYSYFLERMLHSMISESTGTPLHLMFLTNDESKDILMRILNEEVGKVITRKLLTKNFVDSNTKNNWKMPRFKVDLLSIDYFSGHYKEKIDDYVEILCPDEFDVFAKDPNTGKSFSYRYKGRSECKQSYKWVQFLLYDALPISFKHIILLDIDLRFRIDVGSLYEYFSAMSQTEKVGLAKDWWDMSQETAWYRGEFPEGLQIGEPFPNSHSLNSGVVLLDLEKIRRHCNSTYSIFNPVKIESYIEEFKIPTWGDQIIYSLIRWKEENQVYILPCTYNYQTLIKKNHETDEDYDVELDFPWCQGCKLNDYHKCSGQAKIEHFRNWQLKDRFPTLFRYNSIFRMSTWCDNSQWTHCF